MNNNINIIEALTQIAREKKVSRDLVVETLTDALISAAKKRYGNSDNFEVELNADTGQMAVWARKVVVEDVEEEATEIDLEDAKLIDSKVQLGAVVLDKLNFADFGRNAIQTAKQILIQRVREAERERTYEEFSGRIGQIESGTVQQISHGDIILAFGRAEAAIPLKEQIRRERYRQGDTVRGYIFEVLKSSRGPQILLSRTHPELLKRLFHIEVPEIADGIVKVHAVARDPGERAKIAVSSNDDRVDPVGACVGVKGARVQAIVRELSGERIDIVPWIDHPETFIGRALSPAEVVRVIVDHRRKHATAIVDESQLSLAIGKSGQNSRLAFQLTGYGLDIITENEYQERREKTEADQLVLRKLQGVSELIALSLSTSGFNDIESIAEASIALLHTVPGLEGDAAIELKDVAAKYLLQDNASDLAKEEDSTEAQDEIKLTTADEDSADNESTPSSVEVEDSKVSEDSEEVQSNDNSA